eukprot:jgi/Orpsp1_1/1174587/evm.model.c7180000050668.2
MQCVIILIFINIVNADIDNINIDNDNKDKYYLIHVDNKHGEYNIFSNSKNQKRQESQLFVESLVNEINNLIISNKDTYQNPEKLDEIEYASQLKKRSENQSSSNNFSDSDFVYPISSVKNRVVLYAFLSEELANRIKFYDNVIDCVPDSFVSIQQQKFYNEEDILIESGWKGLNVKENADLHLSLLSQGIYNKMNANQYDNNYYYPSSAGKDIDIVIIDSGFQFEYSEFSNTNERIVRCAANIERGKSNIDEIDDYCGFSGSTYHGETVSDLAGGLKHGAAPLANIYGISVPTSNGGKMKKSDILAGIQFAYENLIRPHKTIINLSIVDYQQESSEYYIQMKTLTDSISEKGGIIVASAGNDKKKIGEGSERVIPCEFDSVICIGGINSDKDMNKDSDLVIVFPGDVKEKDLKDYEKIYKIDKNSNYGPGVDFYAPYHVFVEYLKYNKVIKTVDAGTSFSTPLAAGVIATIMSDHPEIEFTKEMMYSYLYEKGKYEVVKSEVDENITGILINNGKHIVYSEDNVYIGCGIYAGNRPCASETPVLPSSFATKSYPVEESNSPVISMEGDRCGPIYGECTKPNECCSQYGYCGKSYDYCGVGCQPVYGLCN